MASKPKAIARQVGKAVTRRYLEAAQQVLMNESFRHNGLQPGL